MEQPVIIKNGQDEAKQYEQWCFKQTVEIEHLKQQVEDEKMTLLAEAAQLREERRQLEREKRAFLRQQEAESSRVKQQQHLFDMKWKIMEEELSKLAEEKQQVRRQREFYSKVNEYEKNRSTDYSASNVVKGELFFVGVTDGESLKRRYKDLIKIYHPDNLAGDTGTLQEINREYDKLKKRLG